MLSCSEDSTELLKTVAETGELDKIRWSDLQAAIKDRLKNVLDYYLEKNKDGREEEFQEAYNEKFNFETSRDEILELINSFNDAPFTIQRICELLHSPFTHYDRLSTFLRGLEKNLRVTSSNSNWPNERNRRGCGDSSETSRNDSNNCEVAQPPCQHQTEEASIEPTTAHSPHPLPPPLVPQVTKEETPQNEDDHGQQNKD